MTPDQFVSKLAERFPVEFRREVLLTARQVFRFQADNLFDAQFSNGHPVRQSDILGARRWLDQLIEAAELAAKPEGIAVPFPRDHVCPDCKHEHETREECKKYLGEGRFCPCMAKVTA